MPLDNTDLFKMQAENAVWVNSKEEAFELLRGFDPKIRRALDFETTCLFPWDGGTIRLTTITDDTGTYVIDHFKAGHFELYADLIAQLKWAVFNACFEGRWIDYYTEGGDFECTVDLLDIQFLKKAKMGGMPLSLAKMVKADLKVDLDKTEQNGSWGSEELTHEQKVYAALDGVVTWEELKYWMEKLTPEQFHGAKVLNDAWRGTAEMEDTALQLDVTYHKKLLELWKIKNKTAYKYMRKIADESIIGNLNSDMQLGSFFRDHILTDEDYKAWPRTNTGRMVMDKTVLRQVAHRMPYPVNRWIAALLIYKKTNKYISTYGQKLIDSQIRLGKIPSRFNMAQAITGRYSSSSFNLQNIPNNPVVRRSFIAMREAFIAGFVPTGRDLVLVMADYSSIEVRVLAELSGDEKLLYDAIYGDVHSRSASQIFGIDFDEFVKVLHETDPNDPTRLNPRYDNIRPYYKSLRTRAKSFTFQLLYGAGVGALAIVLKCTDEEAYAAIMAWADLYPKAYRYREKMYEEMVTTGYLPVCDGRTIFVFKGERSMPVAANYPVQGAAASVMYRAVYHTHKLLLDSRINAKMAASVHDELLLYSRRHCSERAKNLLQQGMNLGWLDIFPGTDLHGLAEAKIGNHWGDK